MFRHTKNIFIWIMTVVIMFALCSPVTGSLLGLLIISQNVNSLATVFVGVIGGIIIAYYFPIIANDFINTFKFLKR